MLASGLRNLGCRNSSKSVSNDRAGRIDGFNNTFKCVRTLTEGEDSQYCEFEDNEHFVEYYDHATDPWQLTNLAGKVPQKPASSAARSDLVPRGLCARRAEEMQGSLF